MPQSSSRGEDNFCLPVRKGHRFVLRPPTLLLPPPVWHPGVKAQALRWSHVRQLTSAQCRAFAFPPCPVVWQCLDRGVPFLTCLGTFQHAFLSCWLTFAGFDFGVFGGRQYCC